MSEQKPVPGIPGGQITTPNPIEIFWEKNKKTILGFVSLLAVVIIAKNVYRYMEKRKRDQTWSRIAQDTEVRSFYAPPEFDASLMGMNFGGQQGADQYKHQLYRFALGLQWEKSFGGFLDQLDSLSESELERTARDFEGNRAGIWASWALACRYKIRGEVDKLKKVLDSLKEKDPDFPLLMEWDHPPVYVPLPGEEKEAESRDEARRPEVPERNALTRLMLDFAERDRNFRKARPELFKAPKPGGKTVEFETSAGRIVVGLYEKEAPRTCENFLKNCKEGFYEGLRFHEIRRMGKDPGSQKVPGMVYLGNPTSKEEDRSKWKPFHSKETLPFEKSRISHFPFVIAADRDESKVDSDSKVFYFTVEDAAVERDGANVVFGLVLEGRDVLTKIVQADLSSSPEENLGTGKPKDPILVKKVTVK